MTTRGQSPVEESLEEAGGGQRVELLLLPLAGDLLPAALALDDGLLGVEAAEPLVDEHDRTARPFPDRLPPRRGRPGGRAKRVVHVQRQPDDQSLDPFGLHHAQHFYRAVIDADLGAGGHVAALLGAAGDAEAVSLGGLRLAPAEARGGTFEHGPQTGVFQVAQSEGIC